MAPTDRARLARELDAAVWALSSRGLVLAAQWAAEALAGLDVPYEPARPPLAQPGTVRAKLYFDSNEYARCTYHLQTATDATGVFLRLYAKYLHGERRKDRGLANKFEFRQELEPNPFLTELLRDTTALLAGDHAGDAFLLYLQGVLLLAKDQRARAATALIQSVVRFPYNWSAWQELLKCSRLQSEAIGLYPQLDAVEDKSMLLLYKVYVQERFFATEERVRGQLQQAAEIFPQFLFVDVLRALAFEHDSNHAQASEVLEAVIKADPFRLGELETYSNILFVAGKTMQLSNLATSVEKIDMYRAETCCIVANYFGLIGDHERAVVYYQRALVAHRQHRWAWTLLGHEYIELRNINAAIQSYLTAVDIDARDYNAWYGLGQAYEVMNEFVSSQYHYKRALAIRPSDTRIWNAVANVYERLNKFEDAIAAYQQAIRILPGEAFFPYRLALAYESNNDAAMATRYMQHTVTIASDDDLRWRGQASIWLARQAMREDRWADARSHAAQIADEGIYGAALEDEARALVRDATNRIQAQ